jgi:hypothetical protein
MVKQGGLSHSAALMAAGQNIIFAFDQFGTPPVAKATEPQTVVALEAGLSLEELDEGLDWVRWLLQSVRQRCESICFCPVETKASGVHAEWKTFVRERFESLHAPMLRKAVALSMQGDVVALAALAREWSKSLTRREAAASLEAGHNLLHVTRGAKYQGALGRYRQLVEEGGALPDCFIVWALVGQMFQLTPITIMAEALRLEWELGVRDLNVLPEPQGETSISSTVMRLARAQCDEPWVPVSERRVG